jgi:hypothetical protein
MSHNVERSAIQRERQAPAAAPDRTGIAASPQPPPPRPLRTDDGIQQPGVPVLRRLPVLGSGLALGAAFALFVAGPTMPEGMRLADRVLVWATVMGGPVVGTAWDMGSGISLGWLGLLLIPAHPVRPSVATGCITLLGLALWFFAGFVTVVVAVWGA